MLEDGFRHLTPKSLKQFFHLYRPEGFEWSDSKARALPLEQSSDLLNYPEVIPEKDLFITVKSNLHRHILDKGLNSRDEEWIVLSHTKEMAQRIGNMTGQTPIIGILKVKKALQVGARFYKAGEFLVLTKYIRPDWLDMPPLPKEKRQSDEMAASAGSKRRDKGKKRVKHQQEKQNRENRPKEPVPNSAGSFFISPDDFMGLVEKGSGRRRRRSAAKGAKKGIKKKKSKK